MLLSWGQLGLGRNTALALSFSCHRGSSLKKYSYILVSVGSLDASYKEAICCILVDLEYSRSNNE